MATTQRDPRPLAQSPVEMFTVHVCFPFQFTPHSVETLDRILGTTRCEHGYTQTLSNCDLEIIKFPTGYLSHGE